MKKPTKEISGDKLVRLSECTFWERQRAFYQKKGINAWSNKIPFYATSNAYIAEAYAQIYFGLLSDLAQSKQIDFEKPVYMIELGTGPGIFTFNLIRKLLGLLRASGLHSIKLVYVMTDFHDRHFKFWREHLALQPFFEEGHLDFAQFDIEKDKQLYLEVRRKNISDNNNPAFVVANYIFDSVAQDLFKITDGKLSEGLLKRSVVLKRKGENIAFGLSKVAKGLAYREITFPYYKKNPTLDMVLSQAAEEIKNGYLMIPLGAIQCIDTLKSILGENIFVVATDKGYAKHFSVLSEFEPSIAFHGSAFSFQVSFYAIGKYLQYKKGEALHQNQHQSIETSVFSLAQPFKNLPLSQQLIPIYCNTLSGGSLFGLYRHFTETPTEPNLETILSLLQLLQWDTEIFNNLLSKILAHSKKITVSEHEDLKNSLEKIAENFYYMPGCLNALANVAAVFQQIGELQEALKYYEKSLKWFEKRETTFYNMGLCFQSLGQHEEALQAFKKAVEINPDHIISKGMIAHINEAQQKKTDG